MTLRVKQLTLVFTGIALLFFTAIPLFLPEKKFTMGRNNSSTSEYTNIGLVPIVKFSGKEASYFSDSSEPDTTAWKKHCLPSGPCFQYPDNYRTCSSLISEEVVYLISKTSDCKTNQDAPNFVIQKLGLPAAESGGIDPAYQAYKEERGSVLNQVTSDLLVGKTLNAEVLCFNTKYNRACQVTFNGGKAYSLDGRNYNSPELTSVDRDHIRTTFNGLVYSMMKLNPSSQVSRLTLNDLNESFLSSIEHQKLKGQIENFSLYQSDAATQLGGMDCGQSTRADQLAVLNKGDKRSLNFNNGLLITATPNTFSWTPADLAAFVEDETVVCGVGTTVPRVIVQDQILWWNACLGGAGPPSKNSADYQRTVHCLQAQEVVQAHFRLTNQ